jgi:hypothetical protein
MNYRHSYHAGNFADVLKHAVLAQIIGYLKRKDQAFRSSTPMPAPGSTIFRRPKRRRPASGARASAG